MSVLQAFAALILAFGSGLILRAVWLSDTRPAVRTSKRRTRTSGALKQAA